MSFKIEPCPCCGNRLPFTYISSSCVVLECTCGIGVDAQKGGAARILYPRSEVPEELKPYQYDIDMENNLNDYVCVSALAALKFSGGLDVWNRRNLL